MVRAPKGGRAAGVSEAKDEMGEVGEGSQSWWWLGGCKVGVKIWEVRVGEVGILL